MANQFLVKETMMTSPQKTGALRNREFGERSDFLNNNGEKSLEDFLRKGKLIFLIYTEAP